MKIKRKHKDESRYIYFWFNTPFFKYNANKPIVNILTVWKTFVFIAPSAPALNTPFLYSGYLLN